MAAAVSPLKDMPPPDCILTLSAASFPAPSALLVLNIKHPCALPFTISVVICATSLNAPVLPLLVNCIAGSTVALVD